MFKLDRIFASFDAPAPRLRLLPTNLLSRLLFGMAILCAIVALVMAAIAPARAADPTTILLTDRNGQIPFPIAPPNRATGGPGSIDNMTIGGNTPRAGTFTTVNTGGQACTATPCLFSGIAAAQGGDLTAQGGTSSTSANAGGVAKLLGGAPGATGVGGAAQVVGGAGGATSGAGGAASVTGGAGTAGNAAGGLASLTGGAGHGSAAGGASQMVGGVGGATGAGGAASLTGGAGGGTSGTGGVASLIGGAGSAGNANGGSAVISGGAANGSGVAGSIRELGLLLRSQGAASAVNTSATLTTAQILSGIITSTTAAAVTMTLPLQSAMDTAIPDAVAGDSFDFTIINTGTSNAVTVALNSWTNGGSTNSLTVPANSATISGAARFRAAKTGAGAWTLFRLS